MLGAQVGLATRGVLDGMPAYSQRGARSKERYSVRSMRYFLRHAEDACRTCACESAVMDR
eukprot:4451552-Pyramimonas_sp.AAC.1